MIIAWISLCSTMFLIRQAPDPTILVTPLSLSMAGVIMLARLPITPLHTLLVTSPRPMLPWLWKYFILAYQSAMRAFKTKLDCVPFDHQWMLRTERRRRKRTPSFFILINRGKCYCSYLFCSWERSSCDSCKIDKLKNYSAINHVLLTIVWDSPDLCWRLNPSDQDSVSLRRWLELWSWRGAPSPSFLLTMLCSRSSPAPVSTTLQKIFRNSLK